MESIIIVVEVLVPFLFVVLIKIFLLVSLNPSLISLDLILCFFFLLFVLFSILYEFILGYVIAVVSLLALVGCWLLAKERILGLVLAIVYFILDSLFLLWLFDFELSNEDSE